MSMFVVEPSHWAMNSDWTAYCVNEMNLYNIARSGGTLERMRETIQRGQEDDCVGLPTYSVVVPVNGDGIYLDEALQSVLRQIHPPKEIILVNDAASAGAIKLMMALSSSDDRIRLVNTTGNIGAGPARNKGMENCSGDFVALLDSDDTWVADKMAKQLTAMRDRQASFSATQYGTIIAGQIIEIPRKKYSGWVSRFWLLANNPIGTSSVVVHKGVGLRFSQLKRRQDWAAWIELADTGQDCFILNEVLMYHRLGHSALSLSSNKMACVKYHWNVLRRSAEEGLLSSVVFMSASIFFSLARTVTLKLNRVSVLFHLRKRNTQISHAQVRQQIEGGQAK